MSHRSDEPLASHPRPSQRVEAFTDAVVAIAMTLLVLPLTEGVSEVRGAAAWVVHHVPQLISCGISFLVIAGFWLSHHELFHRIRAVDRALVLLNTLWMATIVWFPVATALTGSLPVYSSEGYDRVQVLLYVGTMLLNGVTMLAMQRVVLARPELWDRDLPPSTRGLSAHTAFVILTAVALLLALVFPMVNYFALMLMCCTGPLGRLLDRRMRHSRLYERSRARFEAGA